MAVKLGKVVEFDKFVGRIVDNEKDYMFLDTDVIGTVKKGDFVVFRGETVKNISRAFFVESKEKKDFWNDVRIFEEK